ncbi:hypothetical protein [Limosilactobacillus allomucosae]|uniref:AttH domain-containing protein n=1 Tax=Limosilactobacillus allomucosae TaxID=3142938 RepID=A0AAU7C146_9LACO
MRIKNPQVTLADEARNGVVENVRSGFLDWLFRFHVTGDDGELYSLGGSILSLAQEKIDLVSIEWTKGKGTIKQLPGSIYQLARFPQPGLIKMIKNPQGTLKIEQTAHSVQVACGDEFKVECFDDHTWHFMINTQDGQYRADLYHRPYGYPLWYGRKQPSYLTQHSITYGYNWAGDSEGDIWIKGRKIHVKGTGQRERYVAVDSSAAELGGWEDWGFVTFDEMHTSFYDMRLGKKDLSVYDLKTQRHYPEGQLTIEHGNWAFMRELDGFVPIDYRISMEVEDGVLMINAKVCNATTWGVTFKNPDNPVGTLIFDQITGVFYPNDGKPRKLSNGRGVLSIRQWHQYPNILPRELYVDEERGGEKFATL